MSVHNILAVCADTREFIPVKSVDPDNRGKYLCSKCNTKVIFRNCETKVNHFAHYSLSDCTGESDIHKFGKEQLKRWLDQNYSIYIKRFKKIVAILEKGDNDEVFIEKGGLGYIADVALYTNGKPRIILEVTHTHKTCTKRPCEWYDIPAYSIREPIEIDYDNKIVIIHGEKGLIYKPKTKELNCEEQERLEWAEYYGKYVNKSKKVNGIGYICDVTCLECGRITYYPIYSEKRRGYLNLCAYGCKEEKCEL